MRYRRFISVLAAFIVTGILGFARPAFAYLDPGSGSYLLQLILAGFLGAAFTLKLWQKSFISFLVKIFSRRKKDGPSR